MKKIIFAILIILAVSGFAYLMFFTPYLQIESYSVSGCQKSTESDLKAVLDEFMAKSFLRIRFNKNILVFPSEKVISVSKERMPIIDKMEIKKKLPHIFEVTVEEKKSIGIWCGDNYSNCFFIDKNGIIFKKSPFFSGGLSMNLVDKKGKIGVLGEKVLEESQLGLILDLREFLMKDLKLNVWEITLEKGDKILFSISGEKGMWMIIFSENGENVNYEKDALKRFLESQKPEDIPGLDYVDLRIKNKVYYKYKN